MGRSIGVRYIERGSSPLAEGMSKQTRKYGNNVPSVYKTTSRSPVELELARRIWHCGPIKAECLGSSVGRVKLDKTITSVAVECLSVTATIVGDIEAVTHPEFLSRIPLTFTSQAVVERKTPLMKFSSIQGSSSPILFRVSVLLIINNQSFRWFCLPERCLGSILRSSRRRWNRHIVGGRRSIRIAHLARNGASIRWS